MKPIHLHNWMGGTVVALALSMLAASCTDDDMFRPAAPADGIAFVPTIDSRGWNAGTRTAASATCHRVTELRNTQGGKSLYLHTFETDSIATPATARIATRGAVVTTGNFATVYDGFGVLAYAYQGEWDDTQSPNYIDNVKATAGGGTYGFNPPYFWPGEAYNMAFFAYAPYDEDGTIFQDKTGEPTLTYTVPTDITEQKELLAYWVTDVAGGKKATMDLTFSHLCTAVKFKVGSGLENAITSISIKNVCGSGTYSVADEKWATTGEADGAYTLTIDSDNTPEGTELTEGENTFMMIPQMLPESAEIEVAFMENGQKQTLTASIGGKEWLKGHTVVYKISRLNIEKEPQIEMPDVDPFTWEGGEKTYQIKSYANVSGAGIDTYQEPMKWEITEYSTDEKQTWSPVGAGQSLGGWLTLSTLRGDGSTDMQDAFTAIVAEQKGVTYNEHNDKLRETPAVKDFDLSTNGGQWRTVNTANCYIVNAGGTYKLPLVYGNAIKNGKTNTAAYVTEVTGESILSHFVNYKDQEITSPLIEKDNDGIAVSDACLIWQDEMNLVTVESQLQEETIILDGESQTVKFLHFSVTTNPDYLKQGNAIVAVRDGEGKIVWSWHIWVTDYVWGTGVNPVTNMDKETYNMMPVNVGWCDGETTTYDGRTIWLRIQPEIGDPVEVAVVQSPFERPYLGNNPYFQWGRKDPMLPAVQKRNIGGTISGNADKNCYADVEEYKYSTKEYPASVGQAIQTPYLFYTVKASIDNWNTDKYINFWNITLKNDKVPVKSIYDPCPVGFTLPPKHAFSGFTVDGKHKFKVNTEEQMKEKINTPYTPDDVEANFGFEFYCKPMPGKGEHDDSGGTIYFPFSGLRMAYDNEANASMGVSGDCWSADAKDQKKMWCLIIASVKVCFEDGSDSRADLSCATAASVRPVKEVD